MKAGQGSVQIKAPFRAVAVYPLFVLMAEQYPAPLCDVKEFSHPVNDLVPVVAGVFPVRDEEREEPYLLRTEDRGDLKRAAEFFGVLFKAVGLNVYFPDRGADGSCLYAGGIKLFFQLLCLGGGMVGNALFTDIAYFNAVKPVSQKRGCLTLQKVACLIGKGIDQISVFHEFPSFRMIRKVLYDRCRR